MVIFVLNNILDRTSLLRVVDPGWWTDIFKNLCKGSGEMTSVHTLCYLLIIWRAPRAGKMNQIAPCDWLPERARWSHLARSGLPAVSRKQNVTKSHIINPLLTKFVRSRWLDIGLVSVHKHAKKRTWPMSSHLDRTNLVNIHTYKS